MLKKKFGNCINLGLIDYKEAFVLQAHLLEKIQLGELPDTLLLVEHPPVLTLGANFHKENLLLPREEYLRRGIQVEETDRGGDVTYHAPGQLVLYPIFNITHHGKDLHRWMRDLEETILRVLETFGIEGRRFAPHTGVWIENQKVAAIGIRVRKWINMHGIALNCNNDLSAFNLVIPCGIQGYGVTSLSKVLGRSVSCEEVMPRALEAFEKVFEIRLEEKKEFIS